MNTLFTSLILVLLAILNLQNDRPTDLSTQEELPSCIQTLISETKRLPSWSPPARVYRYHYKGKTVFYLSARCCDIPSTLFDENCQILCSPSGGFAGSGDGKCNDFFSARTDETLVWQDSRPTTKK